MSNTYFDALVASIKSLPVEDQSVVLAEVLKEIYREIERREIEKAS